MRIELNAGGLSGRTPIGTMQDDLGSLVKRSNSMLSAFEHLRQYTYQINGGVGCLQDALSGIEARIQTDDSRAFNIAQTETKVNAFVQNVRTADSKVSDLVKQNQEEFYQVNGWARPAPEPSQKSWFDEAKEWVSDLCDWVAGGFEQAKEKLKEFYEKAKEKLRELWEGLKAWWDDKTKITPTEITDDVFDENGYDAYGGRQHGPRDDVRNGDAEMIKIYTDIIRENTGKTLSREELLNYLDAVRDPNNPRNVIKDGLNTEGCQYAAMVNTIFEYYVNRENGAEEFERKFGYPMRDSHGRLNYNVVLVDLYSKYDDVNDSGVSDGDVKSILKKYMAEPGRDNNSSVNVEIKTNVHITTKNVDNYIREGKQVVISVSNIKVYNEDGSLRQNCSGHAMVVTGVTEDGRYIVSTWGDKAYIDPKDNLKWNSEKNGFGIIEFYTVEYK
ncbi:MAG: C39 family peptidase [Oscillospiraceae bacterium]|nr:C39 family peptidase [Oscillospiraceae bacterium]